MERILISACLLGCRCRYDGKEKGCPEAIALADRFHLIPACPEQLGGLPTPRPPAERKGDRVVTQSSDVTELYHRGAEEALRLAKLFGCRTAVLKERSPSCGKGLIYDGTFTGTLVPGNGVTAALLLEHDVAVFGESEIGGMLAHLEHN